MSILCALLLCLCRGVGVLESPVRYLPLGSPKALDKPAASNLVVPMVGNKNQGLAGLSASSEIMGGSVGVRNFVFLSRDAHL